MPVRLSSTNQERPDEATWNLWPAPHWRNEIQRPRSSPLLTPLRPSGARSAREPQPVALAYAGARTSRSNDHEGDSSGLRRSRVVGEVGGPVEKELAQRDGALCAKCLAQGAWSSLRRILETMCAFQPRRIMIAIAPAPSAANAGLGFALF